MQQTRFIDRVPVFLVPHVVQQQTVIGTPSVRHGRGMINIMKPRLVDDSRVCPDKPRPYNSVFGETVQQIWIRLANIRRQVSRHEKAHPDDKAVRRVARRDDVVGKLVPDVRVVSRVDFLQQDQLCEIIDPEIRVVAHSCKVLKHKVVGSVPHRVHDFERGGRAALGLAVVLVGRVDQQDVFMGHCLLLYRLELRLLHVFRADDKAQGGARWWWWSMGASRGRSSRSGIRSSISRSISTISITIQVPHPLLHQHQALVPLFSERKTPRRSGRDVGHGDENKQVV